MKQITDLIYKQFNGSKSSLDTVDLSFLKKYNPKLTTTEFPSDHNQSLIPFSLTLELEGKPPLLIPVPGFEDEFMKNYGLTPELYEQSKTMFDIDKFDISEEQFTQFEKQYKQAQLELLKEQLSKHHTIYMHKGAISTGDIISMSMINALCAKDNIEPPVVNRIFDRNVTDDILTNYPVLGAGNGMYSRHSFSEQGVAGKIFDTIGEYVYGEMSAQVKNELVDMADMADLGKVHSPLSQMITSMNPAWTEHYAPDEAFNNALRIVEQRLKERFEEQSRGCKVVLSDLCTQLEKEIYDTRSNIINLADKKAEFVIASAMENERTFRANNNDYNIIHFETQNIPYRKVEEMTSGTNIAGYSYDTKDGCAYRPIRGLEPLKKWTSELPDGALFCHREGKFITFESKEAMEKAIIEMVQEKEQTMEVLTPRDIAMEQRNTEHEQNLTPDEQTEELAM